MRRFLGALAVLACLPLAAVALGETEYSSPYLKGPIKICSGMPWPAPIDRILTPFLEAHKEKFKGKRVLEINAGSGIPALYAAQAGAAKVVAVSPDPRALFCLRENARKLGLDSVLEARQAGSEPASAFSAVLSTEVFDIIVSMPPLWIEGNPPGDHIRFGLSIVDGLQQHLSGGGAAVLYYGSAVTHDLIFDYARSRGYSARQHQAPAIIGSDWCALYNAFLVQVARSKQVDPRALIQSPLRKGICGPNVSLYVRSWDSEEAVFPPLWGVDLDRMFPGMIVIHNREP